MRPTKSYQKVHEGGRFRLLPRGTSVLDLADKARAAAFVFVSGARYGWARRELATWLVHDYQPAALRPSAVRRTTASAGAGAGAGDLRDLAVTRLVSAARRHVVEMLATAMTSWSGASFARDMVDSGLVIGVSDEAGGIGYAAVDRARMRLVDRVASLFIADFLTRPRDYEAIVVCSVCDEVSFKWDEVHEDGCEARGPRSGVVVKRPRRSTRKGLV